MKIINCKIENFGKLNGVSFDFTAGLNEICQDNGWGKSTLATFIRVMFYGFDNEGKRDAISNERRRFKPWQGGTYGGSITFEINDKRYVLARIFGAKAADDVFELRDADTNLQSTDYSSNIGEEIFKIDAASYERTVYISQNDCETEVTDSINAKLGNLAENMDDINNYEAVNKKLLDLANSMSPTRATGSISRLKQRLTELRTDISGLPAVDRSINELTAHRDSEQTKLTELKAKHKELVEMQSEAAKLQTFETKKSQYELLVSGEAERKAEMEQAKAAFPASMPTEDVIDDMLQNNMRLTALKGQKESLKLTDDELMELDLLDADGAAVVLSTETIDEAVQDWRIRNENSQKLKELEYRYNILEQTKGENTGTQTRRKLVATGIAVIAIALIVAGFFAPVCFAFGGIMFLADAFYLARTAQPKQSENTELQELKEQQLSCKEQLETADLRMKELFARMQKPFEENSVADTLYRYRNELLQRKSRYEILQNKEKQYINVCENFKGLESEIKSFFDELCIATDDFQTELLLLKNKLLRYNSSVREFHTASQARQKFEMENKDIEDIMKLQAVENPKSAEELSAQMAEVSESIEQISMNLTSYDKELDNLREKRDNLAEEEDELNNLLEQYDRDMKQYGCVQKTKELLAKAKEAFTAKYMQPLMSGFVKYYGMLTKSDGKEYHLDANARLTVEEGGIQREVMLLSSGYRDLAGICMRMALADAMYTDEKPVLILDDPFVNLDETKIGGGIELIERASEDYQIIYFTCHTSRISEKF